MSCTHIRDFCFVFAVADGAGASAYASQAAKASESVGAKIPQTMDMKCPPPERGNAYQSTTAMTTTPRAAMNLRRKLETHIAAQSAQKSSTYRAKQSIFFTSLKIRGVAPLIFVF